MRTRSAPLAVLSFVVALAAVVVAVMNLHRVANLGLPWLPPLLICTSAFLTILARRRRA